MKFEQHWPRGFRGSHLKLSTFFPYKCMGPIQMHTEANFTSPLKVKFPCTTIILATLVGLLSLIICAKFQLQGILGCGEVDF